MHGAQCTDCGEDRLSPNNPVSVHFTSPKRFISGNNNAIINSGVVDRFGAYYICDNAWGWPEKNQDFMYAEYMHLLCNCLCMYTVCMPGRRKIQFIISALHR